MSRRIVVVTGTRAEFGLLRSTIDAVAAHPRLDLLVVAGGAHLLPPARTIEEVRKAVEVAASVEMQRPDERGRTADAAALGRGVLGFAETFARLEPDVVLVLGDRIEAFAAASAASVGGTALAHVHGGDRAEGVADEAMRHAISDLADLHFAATAESAQRLKRMGQRADSVFRVGSPAVDGLERVGPLDEATFRSLGAPRTLVLHHGCGLPAAEEDAWIEVVLDAAIREGPCLVVRPNHDPGSDRIESALEKREEGTALRLADHLDRPTFVGLLRRVQALVGNSSAGLIEAAIVGCPAINVGPRQAGRERSSNVRDVHRPDSRAIAAAIRSAATAPRTPHHPYGEPGVGTRIAEELASCVLPRPRKRLSY